MFEPVSVSRDYPFTEPTPKTKTSTKSHTGNRRVKGRQSRNVSVYLHSAVAYLNTLSVSIAAWVFVVLYCRNGRKQKCNSDIWRFQSCQGYDSVVFNQTWLLSHIRSASKMNYKYYNQYICTILMICVRKTLGK